LSAARRARDKRITAKSVALAAGMKYSSRGFKKNGAKPSIAEAIRHSAKIRPMVEHLPYTSISIQASVEAEDNT
jgi:hypothetical protein